MAQSEQHTAAPIAQRRFDRNRVVSDIKYKPHMVELNGCPALIVQDMASEQTRQGFARLAVIGYNSGPDCVFAFPRHCRRVRRRARIGNPAHDAPSGYRRQQ
jgi:hypothetical protein